MSEKVGTEFRVQSVHGPDRKDRLWSQRIFVFLKGDSPSLRPSVGPVTGYGNSPAFSFFRPIIPEGMVLDTAVIPQDNIVFLPTKSSLETQLLAVVQKKIKHRTAFIF